MGLTRRPPPPFPPQGIFLPGPVAPAGLYAFDYRAAGVPDSQALRSIAFANFSARDDLHTLGIAYDPETALLYVANHARAGPRIDVFGLDPGSLVATHVGSVRHPLLHAPNAMALVGRGELYVANDHMFPARRSRLLAQLETFLSPPTATVVHLRLRPGAVETRVVARLPFANGIEFVNATTVAVASTSRGAVYLYSTTPDHGLVYPSRLRLPFLPDNLSRAGDKLVIAGHGHIASLFAFARSRHLCNDPGELAQASPETRRSCATAAATS